MNKVNRYLSFSNKDQQQEKTILDLQKRALDNQKIREENNYNVANGTLKSTVDAINNEYKKRNPNVDMEEIKSMDISEKLGHVPEHLRNRYKKQKRSQTFKSVGRMVASPLIYMGVSKLAGKAINAIKTIGN